MLEGMSYYYCGIRGYTSDSFSERWKLVRRAKTLSRQKHIICEGEYIVSKSPINESCRVELGLTEVIEPRDSARIKAEKSVIMDFVISNLSLPGFHRLGNSNRIRSNNPLSEAGVFQQFMEFNPTILKIGNRNLKRYDLPDLIQLEGRLKAEVKREEQAELIANGLGNPRNMFVRFN